MWPAQPTRARRYLAEYAAGIMPGNSALIFRRGPLPFHDGLAWVSQIVTRAQEQRGCPSGAGILLPGNLTLRKLEVSPASEYRLYTRHAVLVCFLPAL